VSAAGVQRAIVRMMFDPAFRDAVYADGARALAGCDVDAVERGWLVRPDPRAYATDGTRRARALLAIEEELPAAIGWARGEGRAMDDFFASGELHGCIEGRAVLTLACAAWLARGAGPALATLVALEAAVARARRGEVRNPDDGGAPTEVAAVVRSPRAALVEVGDGALAWWADVRAAVAAGAPLPPAALGAPAPVLIEVDAAGAAAAEPLAEGLAALLARADRPRARAELEAHAVELGLDPEDATALVDELIASCLLVAA
jgi:hypothetical protein